MTLAQLIEKVEGHAPGSMIPRDWILTELGRTSGEPVGVSNWLDIARASEITKKPIEWLRKRAVRWRGAPNPTIRVTKNNPEKERSPWLFAEEDCWAYARSSDDSAPVSIDDGVDPDDEDAIALSLSRRATQDL